MRPLEQVVREERPTAQDEIYRFAYWASRNPEAIRAMRHKALSLARRKGYVSANYLLQWLRNETTLKIDGVDSDFKIPNSYATIFSRYLVAHDSKLKDCMNTASSKYDGCEFPPIDWS